MEARKTILWASVVVIGLPVALVFTAAASIHVLDRSSGTIVSSGRERQYLLYIPPSYDRTSPTPLVISMHAAAMWPAQQMNLSRWNRLADEFGFIVVYPAGTGRSGAPRIWNVNRGPGLMKDVRFISDLIDTLKTTYNIDPSRIYANGFSLGGGMAFVLSCALSDRIAAVGMVSAAQTLPWSWCTDNRAVPMISFHGTADLVPYEGGPSPDPFNRVTFPPVRDWTANWARRNRCTLKVNESVVAADVTRLGYTNCADKAGVLLFTIQGGGHTWPGGKPLPEWIVGPTSRSIDATREMWAFFREHRLTSRDEGRPTSGCS
jgi:polyhydroxybutyrate depolymerase